MTSKAQIITGLSALDQSPEITTALVLAWQLIPTEPSPWDWSRSEVLASQVNLECTHLDNPRLGLRLEIYPRHTTVVSYTRQGPKFNSGLTPEVALEVARKTLRDLELSLSYGDPA